MQKLAGKTALVTGASRGIGRAIALELAKEGAFVIINYRSQKEAADAVVEEITNMGQKAVAYACDVSDYDESQKMLQDVIKEYGRLDILVNNAGITRDNLLARMSKDEFDGVLAANLQGPFYMIRHAARQLLKQRGGRIINIASVSGVLGNAGQANYAASKAGLIGLTKTAAREFATRGITVNAIAPGYIRTDMTDAMTDDAKSKINSMIPMQRMGTAEEVAAAVVFLASDAASYITGQVLGVDGGMAM